MTLSSAPTQCDPRWWLLSLSQHSHTLNMMQACLLSALQEQPLSCALSPNIPWLASLLSQGWIHCQKAEPSAAYPLFSLTEQGQIAIDELLQTHAASGDELLAQCTLAEQQQIQEGLLMLRQSWLKSWRQHGYRIRPITLADNPHIAAVIRAVSAEFGLTADKGYGVADPNLDTLYQTYQGEDRCYWVIEDPSGQIVGGAGIAPLTGEGGVCELQKMYFLASTRGRGLAKRLAMQALSLAQDLGYQRCYLETTAVLSQASALYQHLGFTLLPAPLGCTGHRDCEIYMIKSL